MELRVLLHEEAADALVVWPLVAISLYADGAALEATHSSARVAQATLAGATEKVVDGL